MKSKSTSSQARTIYDLAVATGLSKTTVSSALSGNGRISESTRELVLEAARNLDYEGNYYAQRLKKRCSRTITLFSLDLDFGVETKKVKIIQRLLSAQGYDVPVYSYGSYGGGEVADQRTLMSTLRRQRPQGIVCSTRNLQPDTLLELQRYREEGGHVVCYGYPEHELDPIYDEVIFDEDDNTYRAARYLMELGHRKIGLCVPGARKPREPRLSGFTRAHEEFGIEQRPDWFFSTKAIYEEGGAEMAEVFLGLQERPTAMCIINDQATSAFVNQVQRAGVRVPQDLSVVSHDDTPAARYSAVPLTSVSHPVEEMGHHVVDLLCSRLNESYSGGPRKVVVTGELVVRESTQRLS